MPNSLSCEQNAFPVCCYNKQRNFTNNQASCSRNIYTKKVKKLGLEVLTGKALSFDLNLSMKQVKKFFVYKCKLSLRLVLLYLVDLFINKLKTKFNNLFYRMILNTKRIHKSFRRNFPTKPKQMLQKYYLSARKRDGHGRSVIVRQNCNNYCWQQQMS